ncbi:hypothetical protein GQ43DRAFT_381166 [Delitschia confertaspora ATCC 74209]|uniref:Autophagy-related protein 17 n=1 Tax=Delitschia confertaspora ATCC 74209 TaxID=1513339 RepID=A0A9P4MUU7_9PLEO|nr:hypothetical protein GQ43DRAFT_381166 [Delitschia confertaspora ATCC 74209]
MTSPDSPSSPASSNGSKVFNRSLTLEDIVHYFVASKRSLNTQTVLWRANEIVTSARDFLEENAVLVARNTSIRNIIDVQTDSLAAVRTGIDVVESEVQTEFKSLLHSLDTAFAGLQSTLNVLRETPIESSLQPPDTPQKHLFDFIDSATVTNLKDSLTACIDRYNDARSLLNDSNDAFDTSLSTLHNAIASVPSSPASRSNHSPVPGLYHELEEHARENAGLFQSLVKHYDLCVTALKHTEGGSAAATEAVGDTPIPSGDELYAPPEPMSEEERQEMLAVLQNDSMQVEDAVLELHDRESEMSSLLSQVEAHIALLREQDTALANILRILSNLSADAKSYIAVSRSFYDSWTQDTREILLNGIDEWENQREFYERFDLAYAELLVEISARRRRHEKAKRKAEEAQKDLDKLYAEDEKAREQFALTQGDYLPLDIWPGLRDQPRRYEVRAISAEQAEDDEGREEDSRGRSVDASIPQLSRKVVERALARVERRM